MKIKDIILAVFVAFTWGSYFIVSKLTLNSFPPLLFGALRFFLVFLFTSPFFFKDKPPIKSILILGIITFVNLLTLNYAINLSQSLAPIILINEIVVPFSVILGVYYFKEKFTLKDLAGIIIALIGLTIVINKRSIENVSLVAVTLTITASMLFSIYSLLIKKLATFNILSLISQISLIVAIEFFIASSWQESWPVLAAIEIPSIFALLYSVIICSIMSHYIWFYLLRR